MYLLADLFNLSLATCELPAIWKYAHITPLHQGGDILDLNNYRPISIICSIARVFEKLIYSQLSTYLSINNILSLFQSGFRPNHSTTTALLKFTNDVLLAANIGELTGAILMDLTKAFDFVDRYLLLDKLHAIGLSDNAVLWFNSYLHNHKQCVVLHGNKSDLLIQQRGVPQGSTLGPLLFSMLMIYQLYLIPVMFNFMPMILLYIHLNQIYYNFKLLFNLISVSYKIGFHIINYYSIKENLIL